MLNVDKWSVLGENERVLKAIEGELDKRGGKEINGVIALTDKRIVYISRSQHSTYHYSKIYDIHIAEDGKDKHQWKLSFYSGTSIVVVDDIAKNDDSDEFFYILNQKVQSPNRQMETTVTHDFNYFLHGERLAELRKQNIVITPFLLKRDNQGSKANGERLLKEKHPGALFIVQGQYKKDKAEGDFIVVDDLVYLYKYDNKERTATLIHSWPYGAFNGETIDYFALKTVVSVAGGELSFNSKGKEFASLLAEKGAFFTIQKRKWHQKILGFRSGRLWKKSIASLSYLLILFFGLAMIFGDSENESETPPVQKVAETQEEPADESDQKKKAEEEKARLATEQKAKEEEAARLAAEQKAKEEEAARLAAEQKAKEEAARLAANVYYKNCDAVRAAGVAPIRTGDPGYSRKLDRDGDGVACEPY